MASVERICPNCGTSNPQERVHCVRCSTNLIQLPERRASRLPARVEGAGAAALVLGATALVARAGLELLARQLFTRVRRATLAKTAPSATINRSSEAPPDYVVRGWRAWSIHYGDKNTSGSEQFEWHIKRTRRP